MKEKIKEFKKEYSKIRYICCPAFNNEKIYFNKHGLIHILRKGSRYRNPKDILRRINFFPIVKVILSQERDIFEYRTTKIKNSFGQFWTIRMKTEFVCIKVVIRQLNNGSKHFFSVMGKQNTKSP